MGDSRVSNLLSTLPGLFAYQQNSNGDFKSVDARGFATNGVTSYLKLLVDGQDVRDLENGNLDWDWLLPDDVERLEVVEGAGSWATATPPRAGSSTSCGPESGRGSIPIARFAPAASASGRERRARRRPVERLVGIGARQCAGSTAGAIAAASASTSQAARCAGRRPSARGCRSRRPISTPIARTLARSRRTRCVTSARSPRPRPTSSTPRRCWSAPAWPRAIPRRGSGRCRLTCATRTSIS